jgi:uncharacterized protein YndB with AHSA1/START domain
VAHVDVIESPHLMAIRGLPDGQITMTFSLKVEANGTRVTVNVSGLDTFKGDRYAERVEPIGRSWTYALANLLAFVNNQDLPHPEGYVAAMFGYRRESGRAFSVERSIWIKAPQQRVWQAITDVKQLETWYSPGTPWRLSALEVGGRLGTYDPATTNDKFVQLIELLDPPHRLGLRSVPEPPEVPELTTYTLSEERGGTRLTLINSGYELKPELGRQAAMEQNSFGFGMLLENVQAFLENRDLPYPWGF